MAYMTSTPSRSGALRRLLRPAALVAALALVGCSDLLEIDDPDVALPETLQGAAALPVLRAGGISDFTYAYAGGGNSEGQAVMSGLFTDELLWVETFPTRQEVDRRGIQDVNSSMEAIYRNLHRARASLEFAIARYREFDPESAELAELLNLLGYTYVIFAENYCSGVPFSTLDANNNIVYGDPQTRDQVLQTAIAKFDSAITIATAKQDADLLNLARVGKGRALLDLGQAANAATAVAAVPTSFEYLIRSSANSLRQNNGIWNYTANTFAFSVPDREGGNGLPFLSANDPRLDVVATGQRGFDRVTPFNLQLKYPDLQANVVLASGIEARLIQAEAQFRAGTPGPAISTLNTLRAAAGLSALTDPGSEIARTNLLFRERAFWMWGTAHRLGDMRRLVRQYSRNQSTVFPVGEYHKGGEYGTDVNFPVSSDERNNPKFTGCIDRSA